MKEIIFVKKKNMLKKINFILTGPEKKSLAWFSLGSFVLALSETISIGLIIPIMGLFMSEGNPQAASVVGRLQGTMGFHDDKTAFLTALIAVTMAIFLFKSVYSIFILRLQYNFTTGIYCRLAEKIMASYLFKPYSFHLDSNSAILFKNMITEMSNFTTSYLTPAISIASEVMVSVAILALLICAYPVMTMVLVIMFAVIMLVLNVFLNKRIKNYSKDRETYSESVYVAANEALNGIKEIQVNGVHDYFIRRFSQATKKYQNSFTKYSILSSLPRYILESVLLFTVLVILLISLYLRRPPAELIPMMTVMGAAAIKLLPSVNKIYLNFNSLHYFENSLDTVYSILKNAGSSCAHPGQLGYEIGGAGSRTSAFRLENIRFAYKEDGPKILEGINIDIPFSFTTAIAGASGAGKSTLIDLLTGLLVPSQGVLYYGNTVVRPDNVSAIRARIGYVPQQIFLIDDTIGTNIAFGKAEADIDRELLHRVVKAANLEPFIRTLPKGLGTSVGERGVRISGGQRQRIGIARALYRNPEVLILDEATSALDGNSEAEIIGAIKKMKDAGMAVVIVAHRLSTISNADLIYVMDQGRIAAQGSFKDLHDNSDIFNNIIRKKSNAF